MWPYACIAGECKKENCGFFKFINISWEEKMKSEFEWKRMMGQQLYSPYKVGGNSWGKVHAAQKKFNESEY